MIAVESDPMGHQWVPGSSRECLHCKIGKGGLLAAEPCVGRPIYCHARGHERDRPTEKKTPTLIWVDTETVCSFVVDAYADAPQLCAAPTTHRLVGVDGYSYFACATHAHMAIGTFPEFCSYWYRLPVS